MRTLEAIACRNAEKTTECFITISSGINDICELQFLLNRLDPNPNLQGWNTGEQSIKRNIARALYDYHFSNDPKERKIKRDLITHYLNALFLKNG